MTIAGSGRGAARRFSQRPGGRTRVRTRVKICGITRPEDAALAVAAGADAVGFVFWPASPRAVTPAQAAAIGRRAGAL